MLVSSDNPHAATESYSNWRRLCLFDVMCALAKVALISDEHVQVVHGFGSMNNAGACRVSEIFTDEVAARLEPTWGGVPNIRAYF